MDLTNKQSLINLFKTYSPSIVIHCAAERRPDVASQDETGTLKLNITASELIAELCHEYNSFMIHISSDYVFDGTCPPYNINDKPNPLNFYGKFL